MHMPEGNFARNKCVGCPFGYIGIPGNSMCSLDDKIVNAYGCNRDLKKEYEALRETSLKKLIDNMRMQGLPETEISKRLNSLIERESKERIRNSKEEVKKETYMPIATLQIKDDGDDTFRFKLGDNIFSEIPLPKGISKKMGNMTLYLCVKKE